MPLAWYLLAFAPAGGPQVPTQSPTLVSRRAYFGVDASRLRDASERVCRRLEGVSPERAVVGFQTLAQEFGLGMQASRVAVDEMEKAGLLERLSPSGMDYVITPRFRAYATARIVAPLERAQAQMLLTHFADLAREFNRTAVNNKYEIDSLAVYGSYMSLERVLDELSIGVTGCRRSPHPQGAAGRSTAQVEGTDAIRKLFASQSSYVRVKFFHRLHEVPRPFTVIFKSRG